MPLNELVQQWLDKAEEDYGFASSCLSDLEVDYFPQICFHFQQSAEKYLKAFIVTNKLKFRKIHDLPALLKICEQYDCDMLRLKEACEFLTDYYVDTRYPVHWPSGIQKEEAEKAESLARFVKETVEDKLKS